MSFLFSSITRVAKIETKLDETRSALFTRQHLQMRLQDLFMGLSPNSPLYTKRLPHEKSDSLIVRFKQGIDPDPAFSGEVRGRIYLDEEQNLTLLIQPMEDDALWRKEILFPHVEKCQFEFFGAKRQEDAPLSSNAVFAWHAHWSKERSAPPLLIRLEIGEKKSPLLFAFLLPSLAVATYGEKEVSS